MNFDMRIHTDLPRKFKSELYIHKHIHPEVRTKSCTDRYRVIHSLLCVSQIT